MGCATGIVKFVMFLFNFIFVVGGILMVTCGTLVLLDYKEYQHVVDLEQYKAPPILLIVAGSAIFLIAFMGCCGVLRENNCMMMTYAVFLTIILLVQVGIAVGVTVYEKDFKKLVQEGFGKSMNKYDTQAEVRKTWDTVQGQFKCCGSVNYTDWKIRSNGVPESCCKEIGAGCADGVLNGGEEAAKQKIYTEGCVDEVFSNLKIQYVVYAAAIIAGIELLAIIFSCCLAARFRRKNYDV